MAMLSSQKVCSGRQPFFCQVAGAASPASGTTEDPAADGAAGDSAVPAVALASAMVRDVAKRGELLSHEVGFETS